MKKESLKVNTMFYSKRFQCFGMCIAFAEFLALMLWDNPQSKKYSGWYHCGELEKFPMDPDGNEWKYP